MQFSKLLAALIGTVSYGAALPQLLVDDAPTNASFANKTLPGPIVNDPPSNATFANQTLPDPDCASSGTCGITGPLPPLNPPPPKNDPPTYAANCHRSPNCNLVNCPGIDHAIDDIIDKLSYMKPSAKYKKGEQMACNYCNGWGRPHKHGVCAWVEGPDSSTMSIADAWVLLKSLRRDISSCHICGRNPTREGREIRVDYTTDIQGHCENRNSDDRVGGCPNY